MHFDRRLSYLEIGELALDIEDFDEVIALVSDFSLSYLRKSLAFPQLGDSEEAIADLSVT